MRRCESCVMVLACVLISACDFTGGVYRISHLDEEPLPACVEETLRQVAGVTNVTFAATERNGIPIHRFTYHAESVELLVDIERKPVRPEYNHYYEVFNTVPPEELVARLRPIMARVDEALETNCQMRALSRDTKEYCARGPFRSGDCIP